AQAAVKVHEAGLRDADIEFQMLYGMAEGLRRAVAKAGYRTRVYLPVGQVIPGMAYLVRRLLENTSNQAWFNAGSGGLKLDGRGETPVPTIRPLKKMDPVYAMESTPPARFFEPAVR